MAFYRIFGLSPRCIPSLRNNFLWDKVLPLSCLTVHRAHFALPVLLLLGA